MRKIQAYTTFEIARLCTVDITTVINWVESGKLRAYRTPGGHRRVRKDDFLHFLAEYKLPVPRGLSGEPLNILIVEDDEEIRSLIRKIIEDRWPDAGIFEAQDAFVAGKLLAEKHPSLVVLDVRLPGVDGHQVCRHVRSDRRLQHTRIVAVSAYHSPRVQREMMAAGADAYLPKPFTPDVLVACIEQFFPSQPVIPRENPSS